MNQVYLIKCNDYSKKEIITALEKYKTNFLRDFIDINKSILKPNLCLPEIYSKHLTTHPAIVESIIDVFDFNSYIIADTPVGKNDLEKRRLLWKMTGMNDIIAKQNNVVKDDLDTNLKMHSFEISEKTIYIPLSDIIFSAPIINIPKAKTHGFMLMSGAVKNLYGLLPEYSKKRIHRELEDKDSFAEFLVRFAKYINPTLNVVDAIIGIEGEGPGVKGKRRYLGLLIIGSDVFATDYILSKVMGIDYMDIPVLRIANNLGLFDPKEIECIGEKLEDVTVPFELPIIDDHSNRLTNKLFHLSRYKIKVLQDKCIFCQRCIQSCPSNALFASEHGISVDYSKCKSCLVCHEICPTGSIDFETYSFLSELKKVEKKKKEKVNKDEWIFVYGNPTSSSFARKLKRLGYSTAIVHNKKARTDLSLYDLELEEISIEELSKYNIKSIINYQSESNIRKVANICSHLNMPYLSENTAEIITDKFLLKSFLNRIDVMTPKYVVVSDCDNLPKFDKDNYYVIKPVDSSNSRGIVFSKGRNISKESVSYALSHSGRKKAIIEEFLPGNEYDLSCVVYDNEIIWFFVNERLRDTSVDRFGQADGFVTVSLSEEDNSEIKRICSKCVKELHIQQGIVSFQIIKKDNKYNIIEMAGRSMGGGLVEFIFAATNINLDDVLINISLKINLDDLFSKERRKPMAYLFADGFKGDDTIIKRNNKEIPGFIFSNVKISNNKVSGGVLCTGENDCAAFQNARDIMINCLFGEELNNE